LVCSGGPRRADDAAAAERLDVERAATPWQSVLAASIGSHLDISMRTGSVVAGRCIDVGRRWCLIDTGTTHTLVMAEHVVSLAGAQGVAPQSLVELGVGAVLRRWARLALPVSLEVTNAERFQGAVTEVLSDAVTIATETEPVRRLLVPVNGIVTVRGPRLEYD
jgi:hypothetical protein